MVELRQNSSPARAKVRCAVYTRKSSEEGLEQEFNSLDAQREACEAYITSQRHEGWVALSTLYDDGAYSGGTMDRPALQRLLDDIRAGKIDVVVVYKVDRLTRSLTDFAKIVEIFDAQRVSFVSVTQAFNTTTSMGRLTLNVLLSFAQFEREVTGERIRDKIAASKKKGMWMGGLPSLGYDVKERKLVVNEAEAATVRYIFRRYLELETVRALRDDLAAAGVVSKRRTAADGSPYGGQRFSRGALYLMLKNRIYRGEIVHKGKSFPGEHAAIVDEDLWRRVQSHLEENRMERRDGDKTLEPSLLAGIVFDASSEPMTPTHAVKRGTRYRYYISRRLITGPALDSSRGQRVPASNLEALVISRLRALLADPVELKRRLPRPQDPPHRVARQMEGPRDLLDRLPLVQMLAPYPTDRLHNQHPPPPASRQSRQPTKPEIGGSILDADDAPQGVNFARRNTPDERAKRRRAESEVLHIGPTPAPAVGAYNSFDSATRARLDELNALAALLAAERVILIGDLRLRIFRPPGEWWKLRRRLRRCVIDAHRKEGRRSRDRDPPDHRSAGDFSQSPLDEVAHRALPRRNGHSPYVASGDGQL